MRVFVLIYFIVVSVCALPQCSKYSSTKSSTNFDYPEVRRDESVVDDYHGVKIVDPYRWLEDPDSNDTKEFIEAENKITRPYLDGCPVKNDINQRLTELWNYPKYSCPRKRGNRYFLLKNTGLQNQPVLYIQENLDDEPQVLLDPNTLSEDGTIALSSYLVTEDGNTLAYSLSESGSDWITIRFKDVTTGADYPEVLEKIKFTSMTWTKDNKGLFYSRYPLLAGKADGSEIEMTNNQKLCYHRLNTSQSEDITVVEFPEQPFWRIGAKVSQGGRYLFVSVINDGQDGNMLYYVDLSKQQEINGKLQLTKIVNEFGSDYEYVTNEESVLLLHTNKNAPNYRLIKIDLKNPNKENWQNVIPEHPSDVLLGAWAVDTKKLVLHYIRDVKSVLQLHSTESGDLLQTLYSGVGSVTDVSGKKDQSEIFYGTMDFLTPGIIYRMDLNKMPNTPTVYKEVKVKGFDASQYEAKQIFYSSRDGTKVPMFIVYKKGLAQDGSNPALVYGYGGFNINIQPSFRVMRIVFMQNFNGVVAIPNIRGGGEYGERWHDAGRLLNKQNVFDDFQAAAEYLVAEQYTRPELITIQGGSNGGLLVAACINQRPELYGAAIAEVGVLDMLRFQKFTIGHAWVSDYGSSDNKTEFEYLLKYSPLHNIHTPENGLEYPATLVLTADHDDRVVPLHSLKFIAALQYAAQCSTQRQPLMARIDSKAGHGGGKPTAKIIDENTDILCFIAQSLGLKFVH